MKSFSATVISILFILLPGGLFAAGKDAAGCKDHPLIPRVKDYYIAACSKNAADLEVDPANGKSEAVHVKGNSEALIYSAQPRTKFETYRVTGPWRF